MKLVARQILVAMLALYAGLAVAQLPKPASEPSAMTKPEVSFQFDRPGLAVPRYTLEIWEDGTGRYQADQAEIPATANSSRGQAAQHIDRTINLSKDTVSRIFKAARSANYFNVECASKAKNIANTGNKILKYTGTDGSGTCAYNYSENKAIDSLTSTMIAIAYTMDEGRRFDFLHRYDRLGLDAEMISFTQEVDAGRALELGTISPSLAAIVDDMAVIQRVRLKAQKMLEQVAVETH
jgi:hypothetical protein